jgi:hypothetical protein
MSWWAGERTWSPESRDGIRFDQIEGDMALTAARSAASWILLGLLFVAIVLFAVAHP